MFFIQGGFGIEIGELSTLVGGFLQRIIDCIATKPWLCIEDIAWINPRIWKRWRLYIFLAMHCGPKCLGKRMDVLLQDRCKARDRFVYSAKISNHWMILCYLYSENFN